MPGYPRADALADADAETDADRHAVSAGAHARSMHRRIEVPVERLSNISDELSCGRMDRRSLLCGDPDADADIAARCTGGRNLDVSD